MVKTVTLQVNIPADRTLNIALPPDIPAGLVELVLVIAPVKEVELVIDKEEGRNLLLSMADRAILSQPHLPTDLVANHDYYF